MSLASSYAEYYGASGQNDKFPQPNKVLAGVKYGPNEDDYTGTAPESEKAPIPFLVRGDARLADSELIKTIISDPGDLGSLSSCSVIFAGYNADHKTGWQVTDGTVVDLGGGLLELRSSLPASATIPCKPDCRYEWTHTLVDATGSLRTKKTGVTKLVDGYAVDRFVD